MRAGALRHAVALTLAALVVATASAEPARHPWTVPGTLRMAVITEPNTLNPLLVTQLIERNIVKLCFDPLVESHPDGSLTPVLARDVPTQANGGISADGRTITFHLRAGVKWHDGAPFTSADVAFTQAAVMNPANNISGRTPNDRVVRLDTPDPLTVVVHLAEPDASFVVEWATSQIVPAHVLASLPNINDVPFNAAPIGTGPFVFDRWERGSQVTFHANDAYFRGKPRLRNIVVRLLADTNSAGIAVRTHELDLLDNPQPDLRDTLANDPAFRLYHYDLNGFSGFFMNTTAPPLDDVRIRRAISLAIDRRAIVAKAIHNEATPATGNLPTSTWAADQSLPVQYDPAASRALLRAAGYVPGPDGVVTKNGQRLTITLSYVSASAPDQAIALLSQAMLREVGIDLELKGVQANVLFAPAAAGGLYRTGQYQIGSSGRTFDDDPDMSGSFACENVSPKGSNTSRYCNPVYDQLAAAARATYDRGRRKALYAKIERILNDDVPVAFISYPRRYWLANSDLTGFDDPAHHDRADAYLWAI